MDKEFTRQMERKFDPASKSIPGENGSGFIAAARGRVIIYLQQHQEDPDNMEYQLNAQILRDEIDKAEAELTGAGQ